MRYLIKKKDGSVSIMTTVSDDIDPSNEFLKWSQEANDEIESHRPMDDSEMPEDRYFRNAWMHKNDKLEVDMEKSRDIHRNVLRELRKPLLEELDVEFMRASEAGDEIRKAAVSIRKQLLRDLPDSREITNATTPEELKAFMPSILL